MRDYSIRDGITVRCGTYDDVYIVRSLPETHIDYLSYHRNSGDLRTTLHTYYAWQKQRWIVKDSRKLS